MHVLMWRCQEVTRFTSPVPAKHLVQTARVPSPAWKANTCLTQPGCTTGTATSARGQEWGKKSLFALCESREIAVCRSGEFPAASLGAPETPVLLPAGAQPLAGRPPSPGTPREMGPWPGAPPCSGSACCNVMGKLRQSQSRGASACRAMLHACPVQMLSIQLLPHE